MEHPRHFRPLAPRSGVALMCQVCGDPGSGAPEQIEVAYAETVVRPLLVQHHVHALEHRLPPGVRRPAPARGHWRGRRQLIGRHGRQPTLQLGALHVAHGQHLVEARGRRSIQALLLLVRDELGSQPDRGERLGRSQAAATEPRVVHEHKMAQGLHCRPLAADALVLRTLGHPLEPPERRRPVCPQLSRGFLQIGRIGRADQQPHWMATVELGLDV